MTTFSFRYAHDTRLVQLPKLNDAAVGTFANDKINAVTFAKLYFHQWKENKRDSHKFEK